MDKLVKVYINYSNADNPEWVKDVFKNFNRANKYTWLLITWNAFCKRKKIRRVIKILKDRRDRVIRKNIADLSDVTHYIVYSVTDHQEDKNRNVIELWHFDKEGE